MSDRTSHLAWHHFRFDVPKAWEVIKYRKNPDDGQLVLSDRYGITMQVFWQKVKEKPKVDRRLIELVKTNLKEQNIKFNEPELRKTLQRVDQWEVYRPLSRKIPVFAGRYVEDDHVLLNITVPLHKKHDPRAHIDSLLSSYRQNNQDDVYWAIGGLDARIPKEYLIDQIELLPGAQKIFFENRKGYRIIIYRFGMMSQHLRSQTMLEFFARTTGRVRELYLKGNFAKNGVHPGVELKYYTKGSGSVLTNLIAKKWVGHIYLWQSRQYERIYAIEGHAREGREIPDLLDRLETT